LLDPRMIKRKGAFGHALVIVAIGVDARVATLTVELGVCEWCFHLDDA
jgi:hypothetical protein